MLFKHALMRAPGCDAKQDDPGSKLRPIWTRGCSRLFSFERCALSEALPRVSNSGREKAKYVKNGMRCKASKKTKVEAHWKRKPAAAYGPTNRSNGMIASLNLMVRHQHVAELH
jgi:hypothetical protein